MPKEERRNKIAEIESKLRSIVICFLTTDRPNLEMGLSRDCPKIVQQHLSLDECHDTLSLYIVSHGGDLDVPWDLVTLLRGHCNKLQAIIPYVCHSAATMIALGCDELIVGRRGQLSPTDPTLHVRLGPDKDGPEMRFGVEDINAFTEFVRDVLGPGFRRFGHEALNRLIDRVPPELLGSINRNYFRIRLLIEKMLDLSHRNYAAARRRRLVHLLTVAYFSHRHFISRDEIIRDLKLPARKAEDFGLDSIIWDLYEDYQAEFQSRKPFELQAEFDRLTSNPARVELKGRYIESRLRTDVYVQTMVLSGTGLPAFNFTIPQVEGVPQQALQQVIQHFLGELNNQLRPFLVAKKLSSYGEWRTE